MQFLDVVAILSIFNPIPIELVLVSYGCELRAWQLREWVEEESVEDLDGGIDEQSRYTAQDPVLAEEGEL